MSMPFYVSPEQLMRDRAEFARKGIARGRSVIVAQYDSGIVFATENPSRALHKISEIYDRIGFAAVGKYNVFENLRVAGIRYADLRGFTYDRTDVMARGLANAYAQTLGTAFTTESKPLEVELVVAEVGLSAAQDQIYRLAYDGSVAEEHGFVVIGGQADSLNEVMATLWKPDLPLAEVLGIMAQVLATPQGVPAQSGGPAQSGLSAQSGGPTGTGAGTGETDAEQAEPADSVRALSADKLEAAVLDRTKARRCFKRLTPQRINELFGE